MPKIPVGDIRMHYVEAGAGDPLVLIMGIGGDHLAWGFQVPAFAERHRVIAFDNRGVGQTDAPDVPYTAAMMADDTVGLMDALGIERAHVLGVSMGGMIAQEVALRHPRRVRTLQLHATYARADRYTLALIDAWRRIRIGLGRETALRTIALWLFEPATYDERPEFVELIIGNALESPFPQSAVGFLRQGDAVRDHDALDRLQEIRVPTLISVAASDILVPPRFSRQIAAAIPGAELHVFPRGAHGYFWEYPEDFNRVCLEFLAKQR